MGLFSRFNYKAQNDALKDLAGFSIIVWVINEILSYDYDEVFSISESIVSVRNQLSQDLVDMGGNKFLTTAGISRYDEMCNVIIHTIKKSHKSDTIEREEFLYELKKIGEILKEKLMVASVNGYVPEQSSEALLQLILQFDRDTRD